MLVHILGIILLYSLHLPRCLQPMSLVYLSKFLSLRNSCVLCWGLGLPWSARKLLGRSDFFQDYLEAATLLELAIQTRICS